jgi:hypothetical protein
MGGRNAACYILKSSDEGSYDNLCHAVAPAIVALKTWPPVSPIGV